MSSQPSWRPNLPESRLFDEKTWLQGAILAAVAYGVTLALFVLIISFLITRLKVDVKNDGRASQHTICLLTYVCAIFILSTLNLASEAEMIQLSFIENRDIPGGPAAYEELMVSIPISNIGNCCSCLMNWLSDILLLWRCSVVHTGSRTSIWLVMAIPGLMLLASFATGTLFLEEIFRASPSQWAKTGFKFEMIYSIISTSLNFVLTLMIVIPLYLHRRRLTKLLGRHHAVHYVSIISMLIESAAVLIVMFIWSLIPLAMGSALSNIPFSCIVQVQAAASYMIIFRVAKGIAWTPQTASSAFTIPDMPERRGNLSNIQFQTSSVEHSADSPITSQSRDQFSLDRRDVLDIESNSRSTVYESSLRNSAGVIERAKPNANQGI